MYSEYSQTGYKDSSSRDSSQPGLEVAASSDPQTLHPSALLDPQFEAGKLPPCSTDEWQQHDVPRTSTEKTPVSRWRRKRTIVIVVVTSLVIIIIALGVGLGVSKSKKNDDASKATTTPTLTSDTAPTASPTAVSEKKKQIAVGSSLGASLGAGKFFYQNDNGKVVQAVWDPKKEATPATANILPNIDAKANSPLAFVGWNNDQNGHLFYLTSDNIVSEHVYGGGKWTNGSLQSMKLEAHAASQLSTFYFQDSTLCLYYQHPNKTLQEYRYDLAVTKKWDTAHTNSTLPQALPGTGLASIFFDPDEIRVLYQSDDLLIREYCFNSIKPGDWGECTIVSDLGLKGTKKTPIAAASWTNPKINDWILYKSFKEPSTISGFSYMNGSSFSQSTAILPDGVTIPDTSNFAIGMTTDTETDLTNEATVYYSAADGTVDTVQWTEADRTWGSNATMAFGTS